ncbi:T9SS type A sorting domain-containing protein [uncultured Pontibacter sp.]|uniref:T9SS type A sorting domain-containing protein n=1 Tax=uncultured Pontibacter sp. TaxID=453356 RepID=UPI00262FE57C|nr:T9SS type A sorting domain-containing protein [uncultured Pontibacter sp.]
MKQLLLNTQQLSVKILMLLQFCLLFSFDAKAQNPFDLDLTFNQSDVGFGDGFNEGVSNSLVLPDGKILIVGTFTKYSNYSRNGVARLNADGTLDTSFDPGTGFPDGISTFYKPAIALQPDGKVIIVGVFNSYNGISCNGIVRLNTDGSLDTSFNTGSGFTSKDAKALVIQPDGKIVISGEFDYFNEIRTNKIVRLNSNGSLDNSFNSGYGINATIDAIALQADGKIVIGGDFSQYRNGVYRSKIARLNSDGRLDDSFDPGSGFHSIHSGYGAGTIRSILLQPDSKIIVIGEFHKYNGIDRNRIARINTDGSLDTSFNPNSSFDNRIQTISYQTDGKILVGGHFTKYNQVSLNGVARLNGDGSLDTSFKLGTGFLAVNLSASQVETLAPQPDGKIVVGGEFDYFNEERFNKIVRLNFDGSLDSNFNPSSGFNNTVRAIAIQQDDKVLVGGDFTNYNWTLQNRLSRLNSDGTLDNSFEIGSGFNGSVKSILLQQDRKIIIAGKFTIYNGSTFNKIIRLNDNGTLDNSFKIYAGFDNDVEVAVLQPDGKVILGGNFTSYNGTNCNRIVRLNTDGSLDQTFNVGSGFSSTVSAIALQPDGKVIVGGSFWSYNGIYMYGLTRLHTNGSIDTSFKPKVGYYSIGPGFVTHSIVIQPDGKIILGGSANRTENVNQLFRLNADGSLDAGFSFNHGGPNTILLQDDGKIILGGLFWIENKQIMMIRMNADLSKDLTFVLNSEYGNIYEIALQSDGRMLVGGEFTSYNGIGRNRIARLIGENTSPVTGIYDEAHEQANVYPNPATERLFIQLPSIGKAYITVTDSTGRIIQKVSTFVSYELKISNFKRGVYFIKVEQDNQTQTLKFLKV